MEKEAEQKKAKNEVYIFTDGASRGNPGKGGYGVVMKYGNHRKELSEGFLRTTNNRMELLAVIKALEEMKRYDLVLHIYSDSKYVIDAINKGWLWNWEKKHFAKKKNPDLWRSFLKAFRVFETKPSFHWVKGHAGHIENERCDVLATFAADNGPWTIDHGYTEGDAED